MLRLINKLKKEYVEKSRGKQVVLNEVVQASQKLDNYIINYLKIQIKPDKAN